MIRGRAKLLTQLLDRVSDGVFAFDPACRFTFWNGGMERAFGLRADDVMGQQAFTLFPFLVDGGDDLLFRTALGGESRQSTNRRFVVPAAGRSGIYDAEYHPLFDEEGRVCGGIGIIRDVTAARQTEQAMRETEARFENMADASPVLLWMSRPDGLCTFFNQTWLQFTGRTFDEEWGVGWAEGVHPEDFQRCMDGYVDGFNSRRQFEMEYRLRRADGQYRWVLDRGAPRYTPDGNFAGFIGSCVDITDRKLLEAELREAVQVRDDFLTIASHELRTPLTSMQINIDSLARHLDRTPERDVAVDKLKGKVAAVQEQTERLTALVEVLLDVSRLAEGRFALEREEVDLASVVETAAKRFKPVALAAHCPFTVTVGARARGLWDRARLEQVVANLLSNAFKYGAGASVEVHVTESDGLGLVAVTDHGIGIPLEMQERIFDRFERAVSPRNYAGFGLGLWIARRLVEAMGGGIRVTSSPVAGATFVLELPTKWAAPAAAATG